MPSPTEGFECKQIFIAHEHIWAAMDYWARSNGFHLDLIPTVDTEGNLTLDYSQSATEDATPTYAFMPKMAGDKPRA